LMKGDGIPLTPASVLYYRVRTFSDEVPAFLPSSGPIC
jgi:hypothetical protein